MKLLKNLVAVMSVFSVAGATAAQNEPAPIAVAVTVDTSKPGPQIDRHIFGQFIEHLGRVVYDGIWVGEKSAIPNILGYRKDVVDALKKLHIPVIRWPGGCFADQYDWRDGIGPRAMRPQRINVLWGNVPEDNSFGTHEFLNFAELIGADAYVSGNMGSMTPHHMAEWLEYMTYSQKSSLTDERRRNGRDKPWQVRYFGVGNEVWGCGGDMRAEYAADVTRRYSLYLNAAPGQEMIKVASGPGANAAGYEAFTEVMMRNAGLFVGNAFQALSLHYYTFLTAPDENVATIVKDQPPPAQISAVGFSRTDWSSVLHGAMGMDQVINTMSAIMDRYDPKKSVALFIDEWGDAPAYKSEAGAILPDHQNNLLDAEVAALTLNIFQRHSDRVKMANITLMINAGQSMILTNKEKMLLTPTYHVFDMYQAFQDATPFPVAVSGPHYADDSGFSLPAVDIAAARGVDGKLYLALVNLDPSRSADVSTNLVGAAHGKVLSGPSMDTHNTFDAPQTIHPVPFAGTNIGGGNVAFILPAKSVAVVAIE